MKGKKILSAAALCTLSGCLLLAAWAQSRQQALSDKLVRLHVLAASDSPEDQAVKLQVRDAILSRLTPALDMAESREQAEEIIKRLTPVLTLTARRVSGTEATVTLSEEYYPTRRYEDFALPAGRYPSLRVTLGAGQGHNWWCVVYPPLCTRSVEEAVTETMALDREDQKLICEEGEGYVIRFRLLELWGELREALEG